MSKLVNGNGGKQAKSDKDILKTLGFKLSKTIGEGTYSKVCLAQSSEDNGKVACKIIHRKNAGHEFIKKFLPRELRIIRHLEHQNIVKVFDIVEVQDSIFIVMEFCRNGDLLEYIRDNGPLDEQLARQLFRQIVDAVTYLHKLEVAHRDLKCENILLTASNSVKIGDFGFARSCIEENGSRILSETYCGSAAYAAPEIIQGIPYDPKMYDIWALGCVLYIMISATMPFDDANVKKMLRSQLNRSLCVSTFKSWKKHCIHLRNLITYLLEPDVSRRATIRQVANCYWLRDLRKPNVLVVHHLSDSDLL